MLHCFCVYFLFERSALLWNALSLVSGGSWPAPALLPRPSLLAHSPAADITSSILCTHRMPISLKDSLTLLLFKLHSGHCISSFPWLIYGPFPRTKRWICVLKFFSLHITLGIVGTIVLFRLWWNQELSLYIINHPFLCTYSSSKVFFQSF